LSTWSASLGSRFPTLDSFDLAGATVLIRSDLNVPLADGEVVDDFRIQASLPTISEVHASAARVIVASHLGRPEGVDPTLSMRPIALRLAALGGFDVALAPGVIGDDVQRAIDTAPTGTIVVLENTRFEPGESTNDSSVADGLADLADIFVNDAFGTVHRAHASNVGVAERLPSAAGRLMQQEVLAFQRLLDVPEQPYVVAMGGAKISDKLRVVEHLLPQVDLMLVGGGMCFTLLKAVGYEVGASLVEQGMIDTVERLLESEHGDKLVLPTDVVVADSFARDADSRTVPVGAIPGGWMGLDIGPETTRRFSGALTEAGSVFWNGPMGVFEWEPFRAGTEGVASAVAASSGYTVIGGGDSVAAIRMLGIESEVSHVSSGGGAGLAMLEGSALPGLTALKE
jgi:phosphoglycerate kinase